MAVIKIQSSIPYDSNIYLITGRSGILLDAGTGLDSDAVIKQIWENLGGLRLSSVLLTHCHADHSGGIPSIVSEFGCPVYVGEMDADALEAPDPKVMFADQLGLEAVPVHCKRLAEGDVFDIGDHRLRVINTPGHTAGGVCFYDEVTHCMFSGDTVFSNGYGRVDLPTGSYKDMFNSLVKLRNVNIGLLYCGHGPTGSDGNWSVSNAISAMGGL